jgi:hypothetical protein
MTLKDGRLLRAALTAMSLLAVAGVRAQGNQSPATAGRATAVLAIPEPGSRPEYVVPFEIVREAALNRANAVWKTLSEGTVIPYQDADGRTVAYMFHFRVDGRPFPSNYAQVVQEAREDLDRFEATRREGTHGRSENERVTPPSGRFRYAHVLASARYDRAPVLAWGEGLSEFYATALNARTEAAGLLGTPDPSLKRIYFTWPLTWYEFEGNDRAVVLHAHLMSEHLTRAEFIARVHDADAQARQKITAELAKKGRTWEQHLAELRRKSTQEWDAARHPAGGTDGQFFVAGATQAPFFDWSFGCTPTAAAMIYMTIGLTQPRDACRISTS